MRKKGLTAAVCLGIGAVMLFASGFSAMANTSGYDAYKAALKNMKAETSLTANADLTVTDNGTKLFSGTANIKLNQESNTGSTSVTFGDSGQTGTLNVFRQDGKVIFKSSDRDVYRVMEQSAPPWQHKGDRQALPKAAEQVIDALMGNMRELATVESDSNGGKLAALHLSGSQIPAVVNALGSVIASKTAGSEGWHHGSWNHGEDAAMLPAAVKVNMPKLTDNSKVETLNLDAKINSQNILVEQTAEINITGTDEAGHNHALGIKLHISFSSFNQTTPDRVDLTGKQTLKIQNDWTNRRR